MDTYGLVAACRERLDGAERSFAFECELVEQLAHAHEAINRSRDSLNQTSRILAQAPFRHTHLQRLLGHGVNK